MKTFHRGGARLGDEEGGDLLQSARCVYTSPSVAAAAAAAELNKGPLFLSLCACLLDVEVEEEREIK